MLNLWILFRDYPKKCFSLVKMLYVIVRLSVLGFLRDEAIKLIVNMVLLPYRVSSASSIIFTLCKKFLCCVLISYFKWFIHFTH